MGSKKIEEKIKMSVTIVHIKVKEKYINDFINTTLKNQEASIKEHGNKRFDFLQAHDDPSKFILYEAYENEKVAAEHKKTLHYVNWRAEVEQYMAEPRVGITYNALSKLQ